MSQRLDLNDTSKTRVIAESFLLILFFSCLTTLFIVVPVIVLKLTGIRLGGVRPRVIFSLVCVIIAELLALFITVKYYKRKGITLSDLGWNIPTNYLVFVFSIVVATLYIWFSTQIPEVKANFTEFSLFKIWGLLLGIFGAIIEETLFRGFVMTRLKQAKISPLVQILITAVAFSLIHMGFGFEAILCTFALGIALGALYVFGKRSLLGPILCHSIINAALEPWLMLWIIQFYAEKFS